MLFAQPRFDGEPIIRVARAKPDPMSDPGGTKPRGQQRVVIGQGCGGCLLDQTSRTLPVFDGEGDLPMD